MSRRIDLRRRVAELEGKVGNPTRLGSPSDRRQPPGRRRPSKCWGAKPQPRSGRYVTAQIQRNGHSVNRLTHPARRWRPGGVIALFHDHTWRFSAIIYYIRNRGFAMMP